MNKRPPDEEAPGPKIRVSDKRANADPDVEDAESRPAPPEAAPIEDRLVAAEQLAAERLDQLLRNKADYENYRKRVIREQTELIERASHRVVERLLPVLDNFERAVAASQASGEESSLSKGVELVLKQLHDVLESEGLERVDAGGALFDPHEHEAMSSHPGDVAEPTVLEVVRPGYRLKGKTIRPALVRVETPPEPEESA